MHYTEQTIKALHQKYAASETMYHLVFTHCQIIWDVAEQLIVRGSLPVDKDLVKAGCLLHDIGVYPLYDAHDQRHAAYITHGIEGETLLRKEGFPEVICRFASHHTGVGLTKQDIADKELPLPVKDYLAETDEEALIMYADKFHSKKTPPQFNSFESYRHFVAEFGDDKVAKFDSLAQQFGIPDLIPLSRKYGHEIK